MSTEPTRRTVAGHPPGDRSAALSSADRLERELRRMALLQRRAIVLRRRGRGRPALGLNGVPSL